MILVTGATGHIGNVLVRSLLKKGYSVRAMVAPREDTLPLQNLDVEIVRGDIRDSEFVLNSCRNVEAVFHLAGVISILPTKKRLVYEVNVNGTNNVLRACERLRTCKLIYTSS
ncbi:MAG: epimerase, partial [Thermotogae bacterium]